MRDKKDVRITLMDLVSNVLEWFLDNKEWLFGGAGIAFLTFLISKLTRRRQETGKARRRRPPLVSSLPNFVLRKYFGSERLSELLYVDIRPRGDPINLDLGKLPRAEVWLQVINHSPFDIHVEKVSAELCCGSTTISLRMDMPRTTMAHSTDDGILLKADLTDAQADHCSQLKDDDFRYITVVLSCQTSFARFVKKTGWLESIRVRRLNLRRPNAPNGRLQPTAERSG